MGEVKIEIPADLRERLEALPVKHRPQWVHWSAEMDAALVEYWPTRRHEDVARALGVSKNTALYRYRVLRGEY
jgi:hypothetical protein